MGSSAAFAQTGLEAIEACGTAQAPALMLMDLQTRATDGMDATKVTRSTENLSQPTIIGLSVPANAMRSRDQRR